jgi:N-acetylmuramoyl-L-alanine amidase
MKTVLSFAKPSPSPSPLHPTLYTLANQPLQSTDDPVPQPRRHHAALLTLAILTSLLAYTPARAQQPASRMLILLDPAHGGSDPGAHLPNNLVEKDVTLAFAARLRAALAASGFTLISTRDSDPAVPFSTDQRAEIANHAHPGACLILHSTASGHGVHLVTSALPTPDESEPDLPHPVIPWNTAQSAPLPISLQIANAIGVALEHARLPVVLSRASLRPLDNLTCPAVAIEIAPLAGPNPAPVADAAYQDNIARAIAIGLSAWRGEQSAAGAAR